METSRLIMLKVNLYNSEGGITVPLGGQPQKYFFAGIDSGQDTLCSYRNIITAGDVRERTRQILNLKPASGRAFGLFLGPLGYPTMLLHDSDPVPLDGTVFSYQRMCFCQEDDLAATRDERSLELVFREVKDMFENHKIHPWISDSQRDSLLDLLDHDQLKGPYLNPGKMRQFLEEVQSFPKFYWSYYYYVSNCILASGLIGDLKYDTWYTVTADIRQLTVLDTITDDEVASWKWEELSSMKEKESAPGLVEFEITDLQCSTDVVFVTFNMDRSRYLFSLILHILRLLHARNDRPLLSNEGDILPDPVNPPQVFKKDDYSCFLNPIFIGKTQDNS